MERFSIECPKTFQNLYLKHASVKQSPKIKVTIERITILKPAYTFE